MKVLFAVGNAALSENIAKKYIELFGETLEYKDVFYFKAILEEVKRDRSYDRIVIAEQLEPIHNNIISEIDKMLFNNIDSITDEAPDTDIIFICSENRTRNDALLGRFYNIGLYNVLIGDERQVPNLCRLIKEPRGKKEAKEYLKGLWKNFNRKIWHKQNKRRTKKRKSVLLFKFYCLTLGFIALLDFVALVLTFFLSVFLSVFSFFSIIS